MAKEKKEKKAAAEPVAEEKVEKTEEKIEKKEEKKEKKSGKNNQARGKKQSKRKNEFQFDRSKSYPIAEAIKLAKASGREKFDASFEVHFKLGIDPTKGEQQVRSTVALPHGVGKTVRIAAFVEPSNEEAAKKAGADLIGSSDLIEQIKKTEKTDFDLAIAEPSMMKKMGVIAKILGTRGLMPSPKNDTVATDPAKAIAEFKKGKLSFKNDETGNVHVLIGKKSFDDAKLIENYKAILEVLKKAKPSSSKGLFLKNIVVCTTMGQGVKVQAE